MEKFIKDFNSWETVNESTFGDWLNTLATKAKDFFASGDKPSASTTKPEEKTTASTNTGKIQASENFEILDLNNPAHLVRYADACQKWIDSQDPFFNSPEYRNVEDPALKAALSQNKEASKPTPDDKLTGDLFAAIAKYYQQKTGKYLPWELAMAQATLEGGLSKTGKYADGKITRPIYTKNPFNIGNVDNGENRYFPTLADGVIAYYDKMSKTYLKKRTAEELLQDGNFKNSDDNRYATATGYESGLRKLISKIDDRVA